MDKMEITEMNRKTSYEDVLHNEAVCTYIRKADESMNALGFTEHGPAHVGVVADRAAMILEELGYDERTVELGQIAAYMHDIGNLVNRVEHSQSGAVMAFRILDNMNFDAAEISDIVTAIGNHDEGTGVPVSPLAAALILADKSDVRRSRVRDKNPEHVQFFDIHDRVNFSVTRSELKINSAHSIIKLKLSVDPHVSSVMEFLEIFMQRMLMCRKAADFFGLEFKLIINEQQLV